MNTASIAGLFAGENIAPYIASKHGVVGITRGVRFCLQHLPLIPITDADRMRLRTQKTISESTASALGMIKCRTLCLR